MENTLDSAFEAEVAKAISNNFAGSEEEYAGDDYDSFIGRSSGSPLQFDMTLINTTGQELNVVINPGFIETVRVPREVVDSGVPALLMPGNGLVNRSFIDGVSTPDGPTVMLWDNTEYLSKYTGKPVHAVIGDGGRLGSGIIYARSTNDPATNDRVLKVITTEGTHVKSLLDFVKSNPVKVSQILVDVNDKLVYSGKSITKHVISPFGPTAPTFIKFNDYFTEKQQQDRRITMDLERKKHHLQFDDQSVIMVSLPGSINGQEYVEMTLQFNFDKVKNPAATAFKNIRKKLGRR